MGPERGSDRDHRLLELQFFRPQNQLGHVAARGLRTERSRRISASIQEFKLLKYLYEHRGEIVDRDELLNVVWGYDESTYSRTVDVHIAWLRRKLGDRGRERLILTVRGRGYKLVDT